MITLNDFYTPEFKLLSSKQQIEMRNQLMEEMGLECRFDEVTEADVDAYINSFK